MSLEPGPKGPPASAKIILVVAVSLGLMLFDGARQTLQPVRATLATAMQPLQMVAEAPADALDFLSTYLDRDELIATNRSLERKVLLLKGRLQKLAALQAENERIRGLLASAESLDQEVLIAEILSLSPDPYRHYLKLNKGSLDGVFPGQALIDGNGIVGQVVRVSPVSSTAIMITDANHGIPVEINRTGLQTIAQGTGQAQRLELPFLPANADVRPGDLLVTSGLGGRFPPGFPVGTVTEVTHSPGKEFLTVVAEPAANLNRGREVLLVWSEPEARPAAPDGADAPAAAAADAAQLAGPEPEQRDPDTPANPAPPGQ